MSRWALFYAAASWISLCGASTTLGLNEPVALPEITSPRLLILAGGLSCIGVGGLNFRYPKDTDLFAQTNDSLAAVGEGENTTIITSCFAGINDVVFSVGGGAGSQVMHVRAFQDYLARIINNNPRLRVDVIGYSFGAWLAFNLAKEVDSARSLNLITVDAINPETCQPAVYLLAMGKNFANKLWAGLLPVSGCAYEPGSVARSAPARRWVNIYQQTFPVLRGNAFSGADENHLVAVFGGDLDPHRQMDRNQQVVAKIQSELRR